MNEHSIKFQRISLIITIFTISLLFFGLFYLLGIGTAIWSYAVQRWTVHFPTMIFMFLFFALLSYIAIEYYRRVIGKILSLIILLGLGILWIMFYLLPEKTFFVDFPAYNVILAITGLFAAILSLILNIIAITASIIEKIRQKSTNQNTQTKSKIPLSRAILIGLILSIFLMTSFATNWYHPYYDIKVPAQNESPPLRFSFWSFLNQTYYNSSQWDELNRNHAIIIAYDWVYPYTGVNQGSIQNDTQNETISTIQYLRDNYPNISIMLPIYGDKHQDISMQIIIFLNFNPI